MKLDLSGRTALVCGASQGIGRACAKGLAAAGCKVIALARSRGLLQPLMLELPGREHHFICADVNDRPQLEEELSGAIAKYNTIEVLVCNSGGPKAGPILEAEDQAFLEAFYQHVLTNSFLVKKLLPGMRQKNFGRVINIISTSVKVPIPNLGVSNTVRAAVASWAKTLSLELAPFNITVNNVLPGYTETPRLLALIKGASDKTGKFVEQIREEWLKSVPAGRFAEAEEVANAAVFLASAQASYINGINLPVDGGRTSCL